MKYLYILIISAFFITPSSAQFDVKLNVDNTNKRLRVFIRNTVSDAPTTSQNISSINMKLLGAKVDNIISIHSGNYTIQMPNPEDIITMSSVSLPSPENWMQNQWYKVVAFNLTPGMEYTTSDFSVQPDIDMDNSDVEDAIMSVQAAGLFNIPLNIQATTLPVKMVRFDALTKGVDVMCEWETASEVNNLGFEILRSKDGKSFEKIGWVDAKTQTSGNIQYDFLDNQPYTGLNYYRLKQVDLDGRFAFSEIRMAEIESDLKDIVAYPNPVSETLYFSGLEEGAEIKIFSVNGELLKSSKYDQNGINVNQLTKGLYLVSIFQHGEYTSKRFTIH